MHSLRKYSENQVAQALMVLDQNGGNLSKTSRIIDIPRKTLNHWKISRTNRGINEHLEAVDCRYHSYKYDLKTEDMNFLILAQEARLKLLVKLEKVAMESDSLSDLIQAIKVLSDAIENTQKYLKI